MHRAGQKIRAWREAHNPPLSAGEFGERYGAPKPWPSRTVYGWEAKGKIPRAAAQMRPTSLRQRPVANERRSLRDSGVKDFREVVGEPEYVQSNFVWGISKLMVRLTPRPSA